MIDLPLAMSAITSCIDAALGNSYSPALSLLRVPVNDAMMEKIRALLMMPFFCSASAISETPPFSTVKIALSASGPGAVYSLCA